MTTRLFTSWVRRGAASGITEADPISGPFAGPATFQPAVTLARDGAARKAPGMVKPQRWVPPPRRPAQAAASAQIAFYRGRIALDREPVLLLNERPQV